MDNRYGSADVVGTNQRHTIKVSDYASINQEARDIGSRYAGEDGVSSNELFEAEDPKALVQASSLRTFFNITKCFIGAASFELPWAVKQGGLIGGSVGLVFLGIISQFTLVILAKCGHLASKSYPTYPDIGREAFGKTGVILAWTGIIASTIGACGSYLIFIGSSIQKLLGGYTAVFEYSAVCTLFVIPPVIMLSWLRSYKVLAPTSILGICALLFSLVATWIDIGMYHEAKSFDDYPAVQITSYPLFLGNAAFLYLIHSVVLPTEQSMANKSRFPVVVGTSIVFVTILNVAFAVTAYLFYGEDTKQNVIDNLHPGVMEILVRIFLSLDLLFTAALFLFPTSEILEFALLDRTLFGKSRNVEMQRNLLRFIMVMVTAAVALAIPFFSVMTGLTGVFGSNLLGFLLPPSIYIKLKYSKGHWGKIKLGKLMRFKKKTWGLLAELVICSLISLFGIAMLVLGIQAFVREIIDKYTSGTLLDD
jgi:proton-coupled amino acid transporter